MLELTKDGDVAVLDIDDGKANAISHAYCEAVTAALDRAEVEAKAVALVGRPGRFCAGFDLNEFKKGVEPTVALLKAGARMLLRLFRHPQPLVVGCTGHAVAGGALVLLTGDTRLAAAGGFKIGLNETAIGMVIPAFGMVLSQYRLSPRHLQTAVIQARLFEPEGAREAGFVDEIIAPDEVRATTIATAAALAALPADAYAGNKRNLRASAAAALEASIDAIEGVQR